MTYAIHPDDLAGMMGTEADSIRERFAADIADSMIYDPYDGLSPYEIIVAQKIDKAIERDTTNFDDLPSLSPKETKQEVNWNIGDFTCSHCKKDFFVPHEGLFFGDVEPEVLCIDCSLRERNII